MLWLESLARIGMEQSIGLLAGSKNSCEQIDESYTCKVGVFDNWLINTIAYLGSTAICPQAATFRGL
jgi:hypothetical protein